MTFWIRNFLSRLSASCLLVSFCAGMMGAARADDAPPLQERLQLCSGCHNMDGNSVIPENPKLASLDAGYLARQMSDFRSGKRTNPVMSSIIPLVQETEFKALAQYFSDQKPAPAAAPVDAKLAAQGKEIYDEGIVGSAVPACSGCHNEDGSGSDKYPRIGGQHAVYVVQQLTNFKSGARTNDGKGVMQAVTKRMNEQEIRAVATYVSTLKESEE